MKQKSVLHGGGFAAQPGQVALLHSIGPVGLLELIRCPTGQNALAYYCLWKCMPGTSLVQHCLERPNDINFKSEIISHPSEPALRPDSNLTCMSLGGRCLPLPLHSDRAACLQRSVLLLLRAQSAVNSPRLMASLAPSEPCGGTLALAFVSFV
jgi:hypothetical protein